MKRIPLTQGKFAIVDDEDFENMSKINWVYSHGYAVHKKHIGNINGQRKNETIYMHRLINKTPFGKVTDHKNRKTLDNRRENLRTANFSQNFANRNKSSGCSSLFKGVCWAKNNKKWISYINFNGRKHLGYFDKEKDAARAYKEAAKKYYGDFAR